MQDALSRLDKAKLIEIVEKSDEIRTEDIDDCFEENRYSRRPNFRLFMLRSHDPKRTSASFIDANKDGRAIVTLNERISSFQYPTEALRGLTADQQTMLNPETLEISFKYQSRYDYIEPETEMSNSIFELQYGFLWIDFDKRFLSVSMPADSLVGHVTKAVELAFDCFVTPINITKSVMNSVFNTESMKRTTFSKADPTSSKPDKVTVTDSNLGSKLDQLKEYEDYESPSSVFEEAIDEDGEFSSTLGVNCDKGKIYLTRQLRASQMRNWGLWRIGQLIGRINSIYDNGEIDELFESFGLEEDVDLADFAYGKDEKAAIIQVMKAIVTCKKKKIDSFRLTEQIPEKLVSALKKHALLMRYQPYCEDCGHHADVTCQSCGKTQLLEITSRKGKNPVVACSFCLEHLAEDQVRCLMNHKIRVDSWYDGVVLVPKPSLTELLQKLINKYFHTVGFSVTEESFHIHKNTVHYAGRQVTKVVYKIQELEQFKQVCERKITQKRRDELAEVLSLLKEKCSKHSLEGCAACQKEKSVRCVMKSFVTFTDHKLHPHHGQEFGDVAFTIKMLDMDDAVFVGIAKSYEKKPINMSSDKGREMLQQFVDKCGDTSVHVLGLIVAGELDQGLTARLVELARLYGKKVVMWTYEELMSAVDFTIRKYGLTVEEVLEDLKSDSKKRSRGRKNAS
ncbi:hypothetical protein [Paenibacillus sediminis]|uniref:Thaumarchaeal output domain-containing protein n=1 Tax=Paenibacillus sediminis TaxID=664909 RepID=A0ABS4H453_9BACL|nr:hypothetical protein [Paenibacillus sediminis]MBP1937314.1 hypothetical protein [Paenibacillus sediminis]